MIDLTTIRENLNNPRIITPEKLDLLKKSIQEFPKMLELRPIVVKPDGTILGGNMRFKAVKELGLELKPEWFKIAETLSPKEEQRFIIEDNVEFGQWDIERLNEWNNKELEDWGLSIPDWGEIEKDEEKFDEEYSQKLGEVIYEPKETNHTPSDLFQVEHKFDTDIEKITNLELKEMLKARVAYF